MVGFIYTDDQYYALTNRISAVTLTMQNNET